MRVGADVERQLAHEKKIADTIDAKSKINQVHVTLINYWLLEIFFVGNMHVATFLLIAYGPWFIYTAFLISKSISISMTMNF